MHSKEGYNMLKKASTTHLLTGTPSRRLNLGRIILLSRSHPGRRRTKLLKWGIKLGARSIKVLRGAPAETEETKLGGFNGKGDPIKHAQLVNNRLNYFSIDDASKCNLFAETLIGPARLWFNGLPDESITSYMGFCERFSTCFTTRKRWSLSESYLSGIFRGNKESLWSYIDWFIQVDVEVKGSGDNL